MHALAVHFPREGERTGKAMFTDPRRNAIDREASEERCQFRTRDGLHREGAF
jgi:hypothetical protein